MNKFLVTLSFIVTVAFSSYVFATGMATCDVPEEEWQTQEALSKMLKEKGWQVRRIKIDGGCFEAYALDENGNRVEAYFNPKTLELIPTEQSERH